MFSQDQDFLIESKRRQAESINFSIDRNYDSDRLSVLVGQIFNIYHAYFPQA